MRKIKIFSGNEQDVQTKIEEWIKKEKPNIISQTSGILYPTTWSHIYLTILYEEAS